MDSRPSCINDTKLSPRSRSGVCVKEYRFSVVVGERVLVDWLIDPIPVRRVGTAVMVWFHANALLPKPEAFEHFFDDLALVDEGHNPHLALAGGADHGIGLPDFLDEVPPFFGGNAAHLIGIPAIVAHKLKTLVGNVLGDGGNEVAGREDLKIAVNLGVHPGAVDDGAVPVHGVGGA
jgi:hypothetical protein